MLPYHLRGRVERRLAMQQPIDRTNLVPCADFAGEDADDDALLK
jgi:hypothetical protein